MLYKVFPNAESGVYLNENNERVDLVDAEVRFYCPMPCGCGDGLGECGTPGTCCQHFDTIEEAITHYNLTEYEVQ